MRSRNSLTKYLIVALCLLVLTAAVALSAAVVAKYTASDEGGEHAIIPAPFGFSCDYADGGEYIQLTSTKQISFEITDMAGIPTVTLKLNGGVLPVGSAEMSVVADGQENVYVCTVTWQDAYEHKAGDKYTVTVDANSPYSGDTVTFTWAFVADADASYYTVTKESNRVELDLYIGTDPVDLTIDYSTLSPDNLHALMKTWQKSGNAAAMTEVIEGSSFTPNTHYTLIFFGDMKDYTVNVIAEKQPIPAVGKIEIATAGAQ